MAVALLIPTPWQPAPPPGCRGDSLGSRPGALSRAPSFQIRGSNGLAGRPRRAPGRPSVTRVIPGARVSIAARQERLAEHPVLVRSSASYPGVDDVDRSAGARPRSMSLPLKAQAGRRWGEVATGEPQSGINRTPSGACTGSDVGIVAQVSPERASERWSEPTSREPHAMALTGGDSSERRQPHSPRSRALSALSHRSTPRVTHDAQHLRDLADACEQAADPILQSATEMESVVAASPGWPGITSAAADRLARGIRLKDAAQHLREDAADTGLHAFLAHRAAGGDVVLVPLPVVVGDHQHPSAPANDRLSWRSVAARLFGRA